MCNFAGEFPEMLLSLSLAGIILSVILLVFNAGRYKSSRYLGGFFFLISVYALNFHVFIDSYPVPILTLFFVHPDFLFYLTGPLLFWYIRSVLTDKSQLRRSDLWHLLPAFIYLMSVIPYLFLSWDEKTAYAALLAKDIGNLKYIRASMLYSVIPPGLVFISRPLLVTGYAIGSSVIFIRWLINRKNMTVLSHQQYMIPWLTVLLGFVFIHLAYYFREEQRQPFNEYRNFWRIQHAKKLIREGKTKELTLEAIGLLSGFSTRNTFYTAFRKTEGIPPSAFVDKESEART